MNKLSIVFAKVFAVTLGLMISALVIGCKDNTASAPSGTTSTTYDSQAAVDMTATALGNQSGGLGMSLGDSYALATTGTIPTSIDQKATPL